MAYGIIHRFPGGTKEQYEASIAAVHPARDVLPDGQIFHAAGQSVDGWTIMAIHDSKASWEKFRDGTLGPKLSKGINGGFTTPPQETTFEIQNLHGSSETTAESEAREASKAFYAALNRMLEGDTKPLEQIWSHSAQVTTMHPVGGREAGWDQVRGTWEQVARSMSDGQVRLEDQRIQVSGDMAYETGTEKGHATIAGQKISVEHRVTNIYRREAGAWKIVHHHTDVSPAMVDVLGRLHSKQQGPR